MEDFKQKTNTIWFIWKKKSDFRKMDFMGIRAVAETLVRSQVRNLKSNHSAVSNSGLDVNVSLHSEFNSPWNVSFSSSA